MGLTVNPYYIKEVGSNPKEHMDYTANHFSILENANTANTIYTLKNPRHLHLYKTFLIDKVQGLAIVEGMHDYREMTIEEARAEYAQDRIGMFEYLGTRNSVQLIKKNV